MFLYKNSKVIKLWGQRNNIGGKVLAGTPCFHPGTTYIAPEQEVIPE